jgi:hypothetical protein
MSLEKDLTRGSKAEKLLKDKMLSEAFDAVRQAIFDRIEQTPLRDDEGLRDLRRMLKLLKDVRANLEAAVRDGKLAAEDLKLTRERNSRFGVFR